MRAPTTSNIPRLIEPRKLAVQCKTLIGQIAPNDCPRLAEVVEAIQAPVAVNLHFYKDEQNRVRLKGNIAATVSTICQRCLTLMDSDLVADADLAVVFSEEEMRNLPREIDPWSVQGESGDIIALVEDELLVALPIINSHPQGKCSFPAGYTADADDTLEASNNPFSILKRLTKSSTETS